MNETTTPLGMIVPVDVAAFCVGTADEQEMTATPRFAGATTVYTQQVTAALQAFLGANVTRGLDAPPLDPLEHGVHLHWALPDALTHASVVNGALNFSATPNRWLVARVLTRGGQVSSKAWIVESDTLLAQQPDNQHSVTLPVSDSSQNFRYLGVWQVFDAHWQEPQIAPEQTIKSLFGSELIAVASGDVAFASFYPNARSAFGFCDTLDDLQAGGSAAAELAYTVIGWYSNPALDPLHQGPSLAQIQTTYKWTYDGGAGSAGPTYTIYNGLVQGIQWNPSTSYIQPDQTPVQATVAVANTPAEALSAYFRGLDAPASPFFETLFTAFQTGLLNALKQPQPDQLLDLEEALHAQRFGASSAGTIYTIVKADGDDSGTEVIDLPLPLADDLNLLNQYQQQYDFCQAQKTEFIWQLFAEWYRIFEATDPQTRNAAFQATLSRYNKHGALDSACSAWSAKVSAQQQVVQGRLGSDYRLSALAAPAYCNATEPVVLLAGEELTASERFGGDGRYRADDYLQCRLTAQLLTAVTVSSHQITPDQVRSVDLPTPNGLPYAALCNALLEEACLLNTALQAALTAGSEAPLAQALQTALTGGAQTVYTFAGSLPSPVGAHWWEGRNPWLPLLMQWEVDYQPLLATVQGQKLVDYAPQFFTSNFQVDAETGAIRYAPAAGDPHSIILDPSTAAYGQPYHGSAILSGSAGDGLRAQLSSYLATQPDPGLQQILQQLQSTGILMQALSGFNSALLMRHQSLQLNVQVPNDADIPTKRLTAAVGSLAQHMTLAPAFNSYFNPIRAGYGRLALTIVDAFGQKRPVAINNLYIGDTLTTNYQGKVVPGTFYLEPRVAQASRLLFRWIAANSDVDESNAHPATSPVCGWLLPNHLVEGFFLYNQQGKPLGELRLNGDKSAIVWQATPGDAGTIDQSIETVLQYENPSLRALGVALRHATPAYFEAFARAIDTANAATSPTGPDSSTGTAALLGRPVALTQVSLRLELAGTPACNQDWAVVQGGGVVETDSGFTGVQFPVVLGDLDRLGDGLLGYFKPGPDGAFELGTFYSDAAEAAATTGVVQPAPTNILLTATPGAGGQVPVGDQDEYKVLLLVDPRAGVHATIGIVPTQYIVIPANQYADTLSGLESTFLVNPILKGSGGLALPVPAESGYAWSWVEEVRQGTQAEWAVTPGIAPPAAGAVWAYSPQQISEGWLRLNPQLLAFDLVDAQGHATVTNGSTAALTLNITNKRASALTFKPGQLIGEGSPNSGTVFYMHLGGLVPQAQVPAVQTSAPGWTFQVLNDAQYGNYWAATPAPNQPVALAPGGQLAITLANVQVATNNAQEYVYFDYYNVDGLSDGVYDALLTVQPKPQGGS